MVYKPFPVIVPPPFSGSLEGLASQTDVDAINTELAGRLSEAELDARYQPQVAYSTFPTVEPVSEGVWGARASLLPAGYSGRLHYFSADYENHVRPSDPAIGDIHTFRLPG